jgi:hypothetical protein
MEIGVILTLFWGMLVQTTFYLEVQRHQPRAALPLRPASFLVHPWSVQPV